MLTPNFLVNDIYDITDEFIAKNNIKGIIFDIDNTLVGFKQKKPDQKIIAYINHLKSIGLMVAIASNNSKDRVADFCEELGVLSVARACKPLTFRLRKIATSMGILKRNIALVGDQVYTDSLGANLCGMISILVNPIDKKETLLFKIKRMLELPVIYFKRRKDKKHGR